MRGMVIVSAAIAYRPALDYSTSGKNRGSRGFYNFYYKMGSQWKQLSVSKTQRLVVDLPGVELHISCHYLNFHESKDMICVWQVFGDHCGLVRLEN
jgi:hypothetical protein